MTKCVLFFCELNVVVSTNFLFNKQYKLLGTFLLQCSLEKVFNNLYKWLVNNSFSYNEVLSQFKLVLNEN